MSTKPKPGNPVGAITPRLGRDLELVRRAAKMSGMNPTSFSRAVLIDAARKVIDGTIKVTAPQPTVITKS